MLLYARIAWFNFATYLAYPIEMAAAFVKPFINLSFTLLFWSIVAASNPGVINFRHIVAYFLIATAINNVLLLGGLRLGSALAKAIKNGELNYSLIRPINLPIYYLANRIGSLGVAYGVSCLLFTAGIILQPPTGLLPWVIFIAYLLPAAVISFSLNLFIGVIAFYLTEADSIKNVVTHFINVFSGTIVPLTFFPGVAKSIVILLPFATAVFGPAQALQSDQVTSQMLIGLLSGYIWAIILLLVSVKLWRESLRHYEAIGI